MLKIQLIARTSVQAALRVVGTKMSTGLAMVVSSV